MNLPFKMKDISGCGLVGVIHRKRGFIKAESIICSVCSMEERGNGLGAGYAGYGIYPQYKDFYCLHIMLDGVSSLRTVEEFLRGVLIIEFAEHIPVSKVSSLRNPPIFRRYFVKVPEEKKPESLMLLKDDDYVMSIVMEVNEKIKGAYVISSGKNMGVFKGVGQPGEIAEFFRIYDYKANMWIAHTRFPTNTPGWWGGAHPFSLLEWSVVHNGEISSYGINKRYLEMFGYKCTLLTDTEVVAYLVDLLVRRHGLSLSLAGKVLAPPFWKDIEMMEKKERIFFTRLRMIYGSALLNGPFAIIVAYNKGFFGLNDRIKLRPFVAGENEDLFVLASEESAVREIIPEAKNIWAPKAGEPVIAHFNGEENVHH